MNDIHQSFAQQGLVRPREERVLGGVCAGLGRRFGIAPWPARILFLLLLIVIPGSQILIYPFLGLAGLAIAQGSASLASADAVEQGRCMRSVVRRLCASMAPAVRRCAEALTNPDW